MAQRQINIRVPEEVFAVLAAAAFVNDLNPPDVVRELLEEHLPQLESIPEISQALEARHAVAAKSSTAKGSTVTPIRRGRGRAQG